MKRIQALVIVLICVFWFPTSNATSQEAAVAVYIPMVSKGQEYENQLVTIQAGKFKMGCDITVPQACSANELPLHTVYLGTYEILKYEVTNGEFAKCVSDGECAPPFQEYSRTRTQYYGEPAYANYPVQYVTYYQARDYCRWAGMRLPTEAEWEKAARGASGAPPYPWGYETPDCWLLNAAFCKEDTTPAGAYEAGASPYSIMDMSGNVWEWVSDWYADNYYSISPLYNPTGLSTGTYKVIRGGSFFHEMPYARVSFRFPFEPGRIASFGLGFRCARSK